MPDSPADYPQDLKLAHFPALLRLSPQPISLYEFEGAGYIEVNQAWLDFFGYKREEIIGRSRMELGLWVDLGIREALRNSLLKGGLRGYHVQCRKRSGEIADIMLDAQLVEFGGKRCIFACFNDITSLTQAEKLLRVSEERFARIFDAVPQCITIAGLIDGVFLEVNAACEKIYGYTRADLIGRTVAQVGLWLDPHTRAQLVGDLAPGETRALETRFRARSGAVIEALCTVRRSELNGVPVLVAVSVDISDRKRAERLLQAAEQRFSSMIEASPQAITITRLSDGMFLHVNQATETRFGYSPADLIGRTATELGVWADTGARQRIQDAFASGKSVINLESRARKKNGEVVDVLFTATVIELDGEKVMHGTCADLSDIKRALQRQRQSEERFSKVFRTSVDPIVICTLESGRYIEVNEAWCRLFGYSREEAIGRTTYELNIWIDAEDRRRLMREVGATGSVRNFETRMRSRDGRLVDTAMSVDTLELDGEQCVVSVVVDNTEHRRAERLRVLSEERFSKVFRASPNPIVISKRRSGARVDMNDAWLKVFGYTREEAIGKSLDDLGMWVDAGERTRFQAALREQGALRQMPLRMRRKSGEIVELLVSAEAIELDGEPHVVACLDDITERMRAERHIEYLATRDHLTGLPNRLLFSDRLRQAMAKAERDDTRVALLFVDLDHFKDINDSLGHHIGDRLLIEIAERLRGAIRASDTLARQGGDEFLVLLEGLDDARAVEAVARKLVELVARPQEIEGRRLAVSCSLGISIFPDDARGATELMRNADMAMYAVKGSGRDGYEFYSAEMNQRLTERLAMENQLRTALEDGEFELHYQPKVDLHSGLVTGCEALLRWHHPQLGMTLPGRFIGIAEESRLIVPIGAWVLRQACAQLRLWLDRGRAAVPVAVNLSAQQFDAGLPQAVASALADARIDPALLEIEITETVMMSNSAAHMDIARRIKDLGVRIALDDFGTGYSSLSYLRQLDVDVLKIDQSFVRELPGNIEDGTIIAAITAMAGQFRIKVVAEGVESQAQADALRGMNCAEYQGFLISQALPQEEFEERFLQPA